jgi:hypothetical protein
MGIPGLVREPFVAGASEILEALLAHHNIDGHNGSTCWCQPALSLAIMLNGCAMPCYFKFTATGGR